MFVRVKAGQTQAIGIGGENIYPAPAKAAGQWVLVDDAYKEIAEKLAKAGRVEICYDEMPPASDKPLSKAERRARIEEYKRIIEEEHWSKIAARIRDEDEFSVQDWLAAAKDLGKDDKTGIVKAIRQRLEELRKK